jgi:formyltetrahydrofolate hydrolase
MLEARTHKTVASLVLAGAVCLAGAGFGRAATPLRMAGAITGFVTDAAGVPQMGAAVILFNRQERQFERALTDDRGAFRFIGLTPDFYSIKVTLAAFVPAMKKGILVSGRGSNMEAIFKNIRSGMLNCEVALVISNRSDRKSVV